MVSNETNRITYDISGQGMPLTSGYEIPFVFEDSSWVEVYLTGSRTDSKIDPSQYTIDESTETPRIKFKAGYTFPEGKNILSIRRHLPINQYLDLRDGDTIHAEELEQALDRLTRICIAINDTLGRTLVASVADTGDQIVIPVPADRAGMLLGFDDEGRPLPVLQTDIEQKLSEALRAENHTIDLEKSAQQALTDSEKARDLADEYKLAAEKARDLAEEYKGAAKTSENNADSSAESAALSANSALEYRNKTKEYHDSIVLKYQDITERHTDITSKHSEILTKSSQVEKDRKIVEADMAEAAEAVQKSWQHAVTSSTAASNVLIYTRKALEAAKLVQSILSQIRVSEENVKVMETNVSDLLVEARGIESRTSDMLTSASGYASQAKASESQSSIYKDAALSYMNTTSQYKDTALSYKQGAESILGQMSALRDEIAAIASQSVAEMVIVVDGKSYRRSVYVKNGRAYSTLAEVQA